MTDKNLTYRTFWSEEDGQYVGLCDQFPSLSWLAGDEEQALIGIKKITTECVRDLEN